MFFAGRVRHYFHWIKITDAGDLGLFAAIGANKAMAFGLDWVGVIVISTLSAAGGGLGLSAHLRIIISASVATSVRLAAIRYKWSLPGLRH